MDAATVMPSLASSPSMRRYPQSGFSFASGRRAGRCCGPSAADQPAPLAGVVLPGSELAYQASSVAGVTGKTPGQRCRVMNRLSAANQARSPGSYCTRPAFWRSTAFSCRSTSNSASLACSPRNIRTTRPNDQRISSQEILSSTRAGQPLLRQARSRSSRSERTIEYSGGTSYRYQGRYRGGG